jgi:Tat protein translocase TatB subunit
MNLGIPEIFVILLVALIVFGPHRLPEVARQVGAAVRQLRQMQESVKAELDTVLHPDLNPEPTPTPPVEETDHSTLPPDSTPVDSTPVDTPDPTLDIHTTDDGFSGPTGSFS